MIQDRRCWWRVILSDPADGAWNMAVDEVLLQGAAASPTLRLYGWDPSTISLGRFQRTFPPGVPPGTPVVRRPTGGGAIYHDGEVTFSVVGSTREGPLTGLRMAAYGAVNRAIVRGLGKLGVEAHPWSGPPVSSAGFCFDSRSPSDIIHGGRKLVGSAQRRKAGRLLLHGSLPLRPNRYASSATSLEEAAGRAVGVEEVRKALVWGFEESLRVRLVRAPLTGAERLAAQARVEETTFESSGARA